jgi:EAL and modified HD-GYP domain-containing signal transduction protein
MEGYVARQAVYDRKLEVAAYELLYRGDPNALTAAQSDSAASEEVLSNGFFTVGWKVLAGGRPALWNVTQDLLLSDRILLLPNDHVYLELLESTNPTSEVLARCRELKARGYKLVLDDYIGEPEHEPLLEYCDWVKVDWMGAPRETKLAVPGRRKWKCLAEKIETEEEYKAAQLMGYDYFQGYFLERPKLMSGRRLPAAQIERLKLLSELARTDPDLRLVEAAVSRDLDLAYKLMTWVNSAASGRRTPAATVKEALLWLGLDQTRRFAGMFAFAGLAGQEKSALLEKALIRARMSDLLAASAGAFQERPLAFLGGLFSMLEALLGKPMDEICDDMALPYEARALFLPDGCACGGMARTCLNVAVAWQQGDTETVEACAARSPLKPSQIAGLYLESVRWVEAGLDS